MIAAHALPEHIGRPLGTSPWFEITQAMIDRFADVTHDLQWIHVDPARAAIASPFRDAQGRGVTVAHGFLTLSLLSHLFAQAVPLSGVVAGVNAGFDRVRMVDPVTSGASIRAAFTLASCEPVTGGYKLGWDVVVEQRGHDKPALVARWLNRIVLGA